MTFAKYVSLATAALVLAGCGGSGREQQAAAYCPPPLTVQDAQRITRFKEGPGRDPRDVVFEAQLTDAATQCKISRNRLAVDVKMRIAVNAGPSVAGGVTRVPFFVRVIDGNGSVVVGRDELADYKISPTSPRGVSQEEMSVELPFANVSDLGGYRIAIGLKPTQEELDYNRRAALR
jgi:hypothetical protein